MILFPGFTCGDGLSSAGVPFRRPRFMKSVKNYVVASEVDKSFQLLVDYPLCQTPGRTSSDKKERR